MPPPPPPPPPPLALAQDEVLKVQVDEQERDPLEKPREVQEAPPRLTPSHCSLFAIEPSPHPATVADTSTVIANTFSGV